MAYDIEWGEKVDANPSATPPIEGNDILASDFNNTFSNIEDSLNDIDTRINTLDGDTYDKTDVYTKTEIDTKVNTINAEIDNNETNLENNYYNKVDSDFRYLPQAKVTDTTPLKCPNSINANAVDWSLTGTNVGNLNTTTNKYDIPIVARGKNLFNYNSKYGTWNENVTQTYSNGIIYVTNPTTSSRQIDYVVEHLPIGKYYLSAITDRNVFYYINDTSSYNGTLTTAPLINIAQNNSSIKLRLFVPQNTTTEIKNMQLTRSEKQEGYEEYIEPIITTITLDTQLNGTITKSSTNIDLPLLDSAYTTYEVNTTTQPTSMTVEYYQDTNKVINELKSAIVALQSATN